MAGALDTLVPKALALVNRLGKTVAFKVPASQTYNPATGVVTETGSTDVSAVVTPPSAYHVRLVDGDMIRQGDVKVSVPASGLSFTPVPGQKVVIDSKTWHVVAVRPVYTGELIALYELQLRGAT